MKTVGVTSPGVAKGCLLAGLILSACFVAQVHSEAVAADESRVEVRLFADQDGGPFNPVYRDFAQGGETDDPEYYVPVLDHFARLNPRIVRFDHVFDNFTEVTREPERLKVDFTKLDRMVDLIMGTGAEPLMCLSYVPEGIERGREIDPPDLAEWEELVYRAVRYLNGERKLGIRYWEVWNEPNLDAFWGGDRDEYFALYAASCRGAVRADPRVLMGGPAVAGFNLQWIEALLDFAKENDLPLDFISWHEYYARVEDCVAHVLRADEVAAEREMYPELIIDEWNYHAGLVPENDDHRGAVYVADFVRQMLDAPIDYAPFFEIKDGWNAKAEFWGRWGMFTSHDRPKANYFCYLFHSRLGDRRVRLLSSDQDVNGIATRETDGVSFALYNRGTERKVAELLIAGLPEDIAAWNWTRHLIDRWHSNPARGTHAAPEKVETDAPLIAKAGTIEREVVLPPQSVSLIELREELWPSSLVLEVVPRDADPARPNVARFFVKLNNIGRNGEKLNLVWIEALTESGETIQIEELPIPQEFGPGVHSFPCETTIPELSESGEVFFTARARTDEREEASTSGAIHVPPGLEVRFESLRNSLAAGEDEAALRLHLSNHTSKKLYASVEWEWTPNALLAKRVPGYFEIPPYGETSGEVRLGIPERVADRNFLVRCKASAAGGLEAGAKTFLVRSATIPFVVVAPVIDGDVREWGRMRPACSFGPGVSAVCDVPEGEIWLAWDAKNLYLAARLRDASWMPREPGINIWQGDSIQVAFDTDCDGARDGGLDDDDLEVGFALAEDGPTSWCWYLRGDYNPGPFDEAEYMVRRFEELTFYEVAIPAAVLVGADFEGGECLGISVLVNDWDDGDRRTVEWGGGIANQKLPWEFREVWLEK